MPKQPRAPWKAASQAKRHEAAEERQRLYDSISGRDKLKRLNDHGFAAKKERAKIEKKIREGE